MTARQHILDTLRRASCPLSQPEIRTALRRHKFANAYIHDLLRDLTIKGRVRRHGKVRSYQYTITQRGCRV